MSSDWIDLLVNIALGIIMFGIGLSLTFNDFKELFKFPKAIFIGLISQIIILPLLSFSIAYISNLSNEMKIGIIIIALCPVGASSNLIVHLFKGNVALSVSLTIINSILTLFTIPFITNIALYTFLNQLSEIQLSAIETFIHLLINVIIPAALGIAINHYFPIISKKTKKPLNFILPTILGLVFTLKIFFGNDENSLSLQFSEILKITPYVLSLNVIGMFSGYYIAKFFKQKPTNRITIAIEVGLQNTAMALVIAGSLLNNYEMEKPILVYAMFTFFTALIFAWFYSKGHK